MIPRADAWTTVIWVIITPSVLLKILEKMALVKKNVILDCLVIMENSGIYFRELPKMSY